MNFEKRNVVVESRTIPDFGSREKSLGKEAEGGWNTRLPRHRENAFVLGAIFRLECTARAPAEISADFRREAKWLFIGAQRHVERTKVLCSVIRRGNHDALRPNLPSSRNN